jgi:voltage-gated potassium channel
MNKPEKHDALLALAIGLMGDPVAESTKKGVREAITRDPMESALMAVLVGSYFFYHAEKGQNPKVNTFGDALVFVSTSMSVGYSDIFPKTEKGKLIATALQTFGPAMSSQILDPPKAEEPKAIEASEAHATQREILAKLDAILEELKAARLGEKAAEALPVKEPG